MIRKLLALTLLCVVSGGAFAQTMILATSNADYQTSNTFSNVSTFDIVVEIDAPMAPGVYINPDIVEVTYSVEGTLEPGTPSGFSAFNLQRSMSGAEFYSQGSSLSFEISAGANLADGVQVTELVGDGGVLTFNGRELDTGRFHPALLELRADGTGSIQNSNNVPSILLGPEVQFGEEYITGLLFVPSATTMITSPVAGSGGSGAIDALTAAILLALLLIIQARRRARAGMSD